MGTVQRFVTGVCNGNLMVGDRVISKLCLVVIGFCHLQGRELMIGIR
jgi:hypothetical protein